MLFQELEAEYDTKIASLLENQRSEFEQLVFRLGEDQMLPGQGGGLTAGGGDGLSGSSHVRDRTADWSGSLVQVKPRLEESFTIHLGAQMKTMHNLRLVAINPLDLCRHPKSGYDESQRLQMALSLYGDSLNAVVLLVNSKPHFHTITKSDFAHVCQQSAELQFEDLSVQLRMLEESLVEAIENRQVRKASETEPRFVPFDPAQQPKLHSTLLQTGDVYVTRHSNLSQTHVVFHLVQDDHLRSKDIHSRHRCINGLRNILRLAARYGLRTLSLPLLLVLDMNEEMTIAWCLKRAELVFKCVKGFMMESFGAGSAGSLQERTVQFVLPPEISPELFAQLAEMLPQIFHIAGPVVVASH